MLFSTIYLHVHSYISSSDAFHFQESQGRVSAADAPASSAPSSLLEDEAAAADPASVKNDSPREKTDFVATDVVLVDPPKTEDTKAVDKDVDMFVGSPETVSKDRLVSADAGEAGGVAKDGVEKPAVAEPVPPISQEAEESRVALDRDLDMFASSPPRDMAVAPTGDKLKNDLQAALLKQRAPAPAAIASKVAKPVLAALAGTPADTKPASVVTTTGLISKSPAKVPAPGSIVPPPVALAVAQSKAATTTSSVSVSGDPVGAGSAILAVPGSKPPVVAAAASPAGSLQLTLPLPAATTVEPLGCSAALLKTALTPRSGSVETPVGAVAAADVAASSAAAPCSVAAARSKEEDSQMRLALLALQGPGTGKASARAIASGKGDSTPFGKAIPIKASAGGPPPPAPSLPPGTGASSSAGHTSEDHNLPVAFSKSGSNALARTVGSSADEPGLADNKRSPRSRAYTSQETLNPSRARPSPERPEAEKRPPRVRGDEWKFADKIEELR